MALCSDMALCYLACLAIASRAAISIPNGSAIATGLGDALCYRARRVLVFSVSALPPPASPVPLHVHLFEPKLHFRLLPRGGSSPKPHFRCQLPLSMGASRQ
jgi:hypothetical protein